MEEHAGADPRGLVPVAGLRDVMDRMPGIRQVWKQGLPRQGPSHLSRHRLCYPNAPRTQ
jgi:hypothetical protein